jgi:Flp pilus assembly protein TadD
VKKIIWLLIIIAAFSFCSTKKGKAELNFANAMAKQGLWKEAYIRWQKIEATGKDDAKMHNNMAIALESMGKSGEAEKEYLKAIEMDPGNPRIKANYESFKTYMGRSTKAEPSEKEKKEKTDEKGEK